MNPCLLLIDSAKRNGGTFESYTIVLDVPIKCNRVKFRHVELPSIIEYLYCIDIDVLSHSICNTAGRSFPFIGVTGTIDSSDYWLIVENGILDKLSISLHDTNGDLIKLTNDWQIILEIN